MPMTAEEGERDPRRHLPAVDNLLRHADHLVQVWGVTQVSEAARLELASLREGLAAAASADLDLSTDTGQAVPRTEKTELIGAILEKMEAKLVARNQSSLRQVINLSGTVLHTNLGRAVLPRRALDAIVLAASAPVNLEYDIESGRRGDRDSHVEPLICELTGAEAATVVNNNAAAVLLVLNTLADGAEVPVSRGELVEIGGSFRVPEVMQRANCRLVEVGATNRTHLSDYERAISDRTALLMKVHTSNFRIEGFTSEVAEAELANLAHRHELPLVIDLGSGNLVDFAALGLPYEPTASRSLQNGADVITFSGDKLLGGPQCGIIAGRRDLLERIRKNPLKRALRLDKMTLAGLAEILRMYRHPEQLREELPTLKYLTRRQEDIAVQAQRLLPLLAQALPGQFTVNAGECHSQIGSGALPVENIPSYGLSIDCRSDRELRQLAAALRRLPRPVVGRMNDGSLWLDLRCLDCEDDFIAQLPGLSGLLLSAH